ncbi:MAG: winged helix-turn-helix transcriptional regulator [Deltaproteobacteria bacterium]|nr:winged helix-turn-helix transcriptional regulator [Deltaproteobacteria bacterium]
MDVPVSDSVTIFKALGDENRFRILKLLQGYDLCVSAVATRLGLSKAAVSQHLQVLRKEGLIKGEKRGYWTHYSVQRDVLERASRELHWMAQQTETSLAPCARMHGETKGYSGKEVKAMCCGPCCERPDKLKDSSEKCTPEQIRQCHGDTKEHPCEEKKE